MYIYIYLYIYIVIYKICMFLYIFMCINVYIWVKIYRHGPRGLHLSIEDEGDRDVCMLIDIYIHVCIFINSICI
jgi:hypothetical protein